MNAIARRLLVAAVRKLLPDAVPPNPGSALALRKPDSYGYPQAPMIYAPPDRTNSLPTVRPSQTLYAPPPAPVAALAPPPRRRRKVVTETVIYEEREW